MATADANQNCVTIICHSFLFLASLISILLSFRALFTPSIHPNLGLPLALLPSTYAFITFFSSHSLSILSVTQPLFESRMNCIYDPAPSAPCRATVDYGDTPVHSSNTHVNSCDPPVLTGDTQASAIDISASSGAPLALPHPKKSRRRRRRRNRRSANENSVPR